MTKRKVINFGGLKLQLKKFKMPNTGLDSSNQMAAMTKISNNQFPAKSFSKIQLFRGINLNSSDLLPRHTEFDHSWKWKELVTSQEKLSTAEFNEIISQAWKQRLKLMKVTEFICNKTQEKSKFITEKSLSKEFLKITWDLHSEELTQQMQTAQVFKIKGPVMSNSWNFTL